jgi:tether containing UBX domain for GLUT4
VVDLSRTFRQTGLANGAKLDLVVASRSPSVVSVALQLSDADAKGVPGGRLVDKFPSTTTLWMILRKFENTEGMNLNFTGRGVAQTEQGATGAGRIYYETPVLNIMGRELSAFTDFQKTLAQLGLNSGTGLIRLSFRKTPQPLEEAMTEIGQYFKSIEVLKDPGAQPSAYSENTSAINSKATDVKPVANTTSDEANPDEQRATGMDPSDNIVSLLGTAPEASLSDGAILGPNQRPISVFAAPSSQTPKAALSPHNEDDYEPTINQAKIYQARLQANSQNQRLPSDAELQRQAEEKAARQAAIKDVSIKVRFPDQLTIVSNFTTADTAANLYEFVRGVIVAEDQPFVLVWSGPKGPQTVPDNTNVRLIKDLGFAGRILVNFSWDERASAQARKTTLKPEFASKAKELQVQEVVAADAAEEDDEKRPKAKEKENEKSSGGGGSGSRGMPKWFKMPGKK